MTGSHLCQSLDEPAASTARDPGIGNDFGQTFGSSLGDKSR
jgi:hypothetical protein